MTLQWMVGFRETIRTSINNLEEVLHQTELSIAEFCPIKKGWTIEKHGSGRMVVKRVVYHAPDDTFPATWSVYGVRIKENGDRDMRFTGDSYLGFPVREDGTIPEKSGITIISKGENNG